MKPLRSEAYLKFVRSLPCSICGRTWGVEASHTGPHGISQKAPDSSVIALCAVHHKDARVGLDRIGRAAFEELHGVSIPRLILMTQLRADACHVEATPALQKKPVDRVSSAGLRGSRLAR